MSNQRHKSEEAAGFRTALNAVQQDNRLGAFLKEEYTLENDGHFQTVIKELIDEHHSDEAIYDFLLGKIGRLGVPLRFLRRFGKSGLVNSRDLLGKILDLMDDRVNVDGYLEIATPGSIYQRVKGNLLIHGPVVVATDERPGFGPGEILARRSLSRVGKHAPLSGYAPVSDSSVPSCTIDLVMAISGLHSARPDALPSFVASLHRAMRPKGRLFLLEPDLGSQEGIAAQEVVRMFTNIQLGVSWESHRAQNLNLQSALAWSRTLTAGGFRLIGQRTVEAKGPTGFELMAFSR
jgi:SAM-dependent methyltransferase